MACDFAQSAVVLHCAGRPGVGDFEIVSTPFTPQPRFVLDDRHRTRMRRRFITLLLFSPPFHHYRGAGRNRITISPVASPGMAEPRQRDRRRAKRSVGAARSLVAGGINRI